MGDLLLRAFFGELQKDQPSSTSDTRFSQQLSESAAVQRLMLISVANACARLHFELGGVSPIRADAAAAAVAGAETPTAAAAAAAQGTSSTNQGTVARDGKQYIKVPPHHLVVLELLLVPLTGLDPLTPGISTADCSVRLQQAVHSTAQFLLQTSEAGSASSSSSKGRIKSKTLGKTMGLPSVPVEWCVPLHCLLAEAAALAPGALSTVHTSLVMMLSLQDVYFKVGGAPRAAGGGVGGVQEGFGGGGGSQ
jgi:hypothetical protein